MTKAEKQHLDLIASLGCMVCRQPAQIHHIRSGMGMGQKSGHFRAIPLCPKHHLTGGHGVAFHAGKKAWQEKFGTEEELLDKLYEMIGEL
jgi:Recombination enhancement, RecA-dependent nuclease